MVSNREERLDRLTNTWTEASAEVMISEYLKDTEHWGGDGLFFLEAANGGTKLSEASVKQAAFLLQCTLRRTDLVARVGEDCFLIFLLGCRSREDALTSMNSVRECLERFAGLSVTAGGVLTDGREETYELLRERALAALAHAKREKRPFCFAEECECGEGEQTAAEMHAAKGCLIRPVPEYIEDSGKADMEFVRVMMDQLLPGKKECSIEKGLERICAYYGCGEAYILERKSGGKDYEISFSWREEKPMVRNDHLKTAPGLIVDRYLDLFRNREVLACNRICELEILDPVIAERQKLRKTRALMQFPIMENGDYIGYISVNDSKKERLWTLEETMTFALAGRVLAARILECRFQRFAQILIDHDRLTEAWNYNRFLSEGRKRLKRAPLLQAVVTMDIKNFKVINANYSYETGNDILVGISSLLNHFTGGGECFARIEADKFALLLEYQTVNGLQHRLDQLLRRVEQIPREEKKDFSISCIMGVCLVEPGDTDMSILVDHANMARKALKDYHKSIYSFYNREAERKFAKERELAFRMKSAADNEKFVVYYQPKVDLPRKRCIGFEALVRWKLPEGQMIPPDEFIPLFEKNGFITELDLYVFERVCRLIKSWKDKGRTPYPIAVNISRIHLTKPDFLEELEQIAGKYGVESRYLELEITENAFLNNPGEILEVARRIKERGFVLSMDDFGTGYSSLSLLKDLPVDIIKLDKEFFQKLLSDREKIIIANVIHLAHELDIQVISEGIETAEHEAFLTEIGCNLAQGYRYGRPAPIEEYKDLTDE